MGHPHDKAVESTPPGYVQSEIYHRVLLDGRVLTACIMYDPQDDTKLYSYGQALYCPDYGVPFRASLGVEIAVGRALAAIRKHVVKHCSMFKLPHYMPLTGQSITLEAQIAALDSILEAEDLLSADEQLNFYLDSDGAVLVG
jgi:hypothetical protein